MIPFVGHPQNDNTRGKEHNESVVARVGRGRVDHKGGFWGD
jgi:hypothetical protein